jgi:hypothetical protein
MSSVRVRVRAADADPTDPGVEVELPVGPGGWGSEHTERVANAVGVDTHSALVSLRFADGASDELPAGRLGWRAVTAMEPGDVLVVGSGATGGAPPSVPVVTMPLMSAGAPTSRTRGGGGAISCAPVEGVPLPEEEQNSKRLNMLFLSGPAEVRKALQQVQLRTLHPRWDFLPRLF